MMVEDPAGHRTLYAPTPQLGTFLTTVYSFHDVQVTRCSARRSGRCWRVQAGPLQASFTIGRRSLLGWLLWAMPAALARTVWWVSLMDLPARRLPAGVRTRGRTRDGRRQWYSAQDLHPIVAADAVLHGRDLGALQAVQPPVGFGFGSVPGRPSLVHLTTMIEAVPVEMAASAHESRRPRSTCGWCSCAGAVGTHRRRAQRHAPPATRKAPR
jgi:hypothetical protein